MRPPNDTGVEPYQDKSAPLEHGVAGSQNKVSIIFNSVGNGDSIIIEIHDEGKEIIGLIDCAISTLSVAPNLNIPTLDWIKEKKLNKLDFIFLSHPHHDHFSGLPAVLDHCVQNNVTILAFYHTLSLLDSYAARFGKSKNESLRWLWEDHYKSSNIKLNKVYEKLEQLMDKGLFSKSNIGFATRKKIELSKHVSLYVLAPMPENIETFLLQKKSRFPNYDAKEKSDLINSLSYVILLKYKDTSVLFTADASHEVMNAVLDDFMLKEKLSKRRIIQVPHHGSQGYHLDRLWEEMIVDCDQKIAVISCGPRLDYFHPGKSAVQHISAKGYDLYSTSYSCGMKTLQYSKKFDGNKEFTITESNIRVR